MPVTFTRGRTRGQWTADRRLYLDVEGNVVEADDPARVQLLVAEGGHLPVEEAERLGLLEVPLTPEEMRAQIAEAQGRAEREIAEAIASRDEEIGRLKARIAQMEAEGKEAETPPDGETTDETNESSKDAEDAKDAPDGEPTKTKAAPRPPRTRHVAGPQETK